MNDVYRTIVNDAREVETREKECAVHSIEEGTLDGMAKKLFDREFKAGLNRVATSTFLLGQSSRIRWPSRRSSEMELKMLRALVDSGADGVTFPTCLPPFKKHPESTISITQILAALHLVMNYGPVFREVSDEKDKSAARLLSEHIPRHHLPYPTGTGKTIIACLAAGMILANDEIRDRFADARDLCLHPHATFDHKRGRMSITPRKREKTWSNFINVIVPETVKYQWARQLRKMAAAFKEEGKPFYVFDHDEDFEIDSSTDLLEGRSYSEVKRSGLPHVMLCPRALGKPHEGRHAVKRVALCNILDECGSVPHILADTTVITMSATEIPDSLRYDLESMLPPSPLYRAHLWSSLSMMRKGYAMYGIRIRKIAHLMERIKPAKTDKSSDARIISLKEIVDVFKIEFAPKRIWPCFENGKEYEDGVKEHAANCRAVLRIISGKRDCFDRFRVDLWNALCCVNKWVRLNEFEKHKAVRRWDGSKKYDDAHKRLRRSQLDRSLERFHEALTMASDKERECIVCCEAICARDVRYATCCTAVYCKECFETSLKCGYCLNDNFKVYEDATGEGVESKARPMKQSTLDARDVSAGLAALTNDSTREGQGGALAVKTIVLSVELLASFPRARVVVFVSYDAISLAKSGACLVKTLRAHLAPDVRVAALQKGKASFSKYCEVFTESSDKRMVLVCDSSDYSMISGLDLTSATGMVLDQRGLPPGAQLQLLGRVTRMLPEEAAREEEIPIVHMVVDDE